jgi:20S proteasome alpha/beta subunit
MTTTRITVFILLLFLTLPLSAHAMEQAIVDEAERVVDARLATQADYRSADKNRQWIIREEALRQQMTTTLRGMFDEMQREVDHEIQVRLATAFSKNHNSSVTEYQFHEVQRRFMGQMYRYMSDIRSNGRTDIRRAYIGAGGGNSDVNEHLELIFSGNQGFENDVKSVLEAIAAGMQRDTGDKISEVWIIFLTKTIKGEFNNR